MAGQQGSKIVDVDEDRFFAAGPDDAPSYPRWWHCRWFPNPWPAPTPVDCGAHDAFLTRHRDAVYEVLALPDAGSGTSHTVHLNRLEPAGPEDPFALDPTAFLLDEACASRGARDDLLRRFLTDLDACLLEAAL